MATLKSSQRRIEPVDNAFEITPADATDLEKTTRGLLVGVSGNVDVTMAGGQRVTIGLAAGVIHPLAVTIVWAAGTTATGVVGFY